MENRKSFLKKASLLTIGSVIGSSILKADELIFPVKKEKIWSCLMHLGFNMWEDHDRLKNDDDPLVRWRCYDENIRLSEKLWRDSILEMKKNNLNLVIIDIADALQFESHPELAINGAWSKEKLKQELKYIRSLGIEPIPKLNFSAGHDAWLKQYSRILSTPKYYEVCNNLIKEVIELFDNPRFFHLGYDEENYQDQVTYDYIAIRQNDVWWKDFYFFVDTVEKHGSQAWIWSDFFWHHPDQFLSKMPKTVIQSNWYYGNNFDPKSNRYIDAYLKIRDAGYKQVPAGGYFSGVVQKEKHFKDNMVATAIFGKEYMNDDLLLGFMQTNWKPTLEEHREDIITSIKRTGDAKKAFDR